MDIRSIDSRSTERLVASRIHRNIRTTNGLQNSSSVLGGVFQRRIAVDRRNSQQIQRWVMRGNQNRKCILSAYALDHFKSIVINQAVETHIVPWISLVSTYPTPR